MSTFYTEQIKNSITFEEFIKICIGAFILDKRDFESIQIDNYHLHIIEELELKLKNVNKLTIEEVEELAEKEFNERINDYNTELTNKKILRNQYNLMLQKVKSWEPPTQQHLSLKNFMIEQIQKSIMDDCRFNNNTPKKLSGKEYINHTTYQILYQLTYHRIEHSRHVTDTVTKNEWLKELKNSIKIKDNE